MKNYSTILLVTLSTLGVAQSISVKETSAGFSTGSQNAVMTTITGCTADHAIDQWKKVLKDFKNEKVKDNNNEVFGDNIVIKDWGNNPVDFYTKFDEDKKAKTVKMFTAVDLGGTYLTSSNNKDKYKFVEQLTKDFAVKMTLSPMHEALAESQKTLSKLEDNQKNLEKDKRNLQDDITSYKNKIVKAEKEIAGKEVEITTKKGEVEVQKKVVNASSGAVNEQAKSSQKIYDKLEGQLKDLEKDRKNLKEDISDYNAKIAKAESDIKKNDEEQVKKKQAIENQKKNIDEQKKKLDSVK
ncbi:MAG: hypothetical protein HYX39_08760 [Bacteroidetes bacterium]|nr:hypothetical protein [Bacteroidota bacterium]